MTEKRSAYTGIFIAEGVNRDGNKNTVIWDEIRFGVGDGVITKKYQNSISFSHNYTPHLRKQNLKQSIADLQKKYRLVVDSHEPYFSSNQSPHALAH